MRQQRLYQVCWISPDHTGKPETARYYMHVLKVSDGSRVVAPVLIKGTSAGQDFNGADAQAAFCARRDQHKRGQDRLRLLRHDLRNRYWRFGILASHLTSDQQNQRTAGDDGGEGAGIWMGGQGRLPNAQGHLYVITGNGDFDGVSQWANRFSSCNIRRLNPARPQR